MNAKQIIWMLLSVVGATLIAELLEPFVIWIGYLITTHSHIIFPPTYLGTLNAAFKLGFPALAALYHVPTAVPPIGGTV